MKSTAKIKHSILISCVALTISPLFAEELYLETFTDQVGRGVKGQEGGVPEENFDGVDWKITGDTNGLEAKSDYFQVMKYELDVFLLARDLGEKEMTWQSPEIKVGDAKKVQVGVKIRSRLNGRPDDLQVMYAFGDGSVQGSRETLFELDSIVAPQGRNSGITTMKGVKSGDTVTLGRDEFTPLEATLAVPNGAKTLTLFILVRNSMQDDHVGIDDVSVISTP